MSPRYPYPPRHNERDIEDRLCAYYSTRPEVKVVSRQVRIQGAGIADIFLYTEFENDIEPDGISRIITVVEVKAGRAGLKAFRQLNRYLMALQEQYAERAKDFVWFGVVAAPAFRDDLIDLAARNHPRLSLLLARP